MSVSFSAGGGEEVSGGDSAAGDGMAPIPAVGAVSIETPDEIGFISIAAGDCVSVPIEAERSVGPSVDGIVS